MSTRLDILTAKADFENHVKTHKCRAGGCPERLRLWRERNRVAALWGVEPGDEERFRQQNRTVQ